MNKLKYSCIHCWATFPSLKLFNVGSTLPAFIWLSHLYSKIPPLSEFVEPTSRFYWFFSSALGRWFEGGVPPKSIHWRAGAWPGWGDLAWFALPLRLLPSTLIHRCPLNHAAFTCLLIHKYTNTQIHKYTMLCCNVNFCIVFVSLSCISYLYLYLYLYFMHIWLTVI